LHDLSHLEIIFQRALSHISMVLFVAQCMMKLSKCGNTRLHTLALYIVVIQSGLTTC